MHVFILLISGFGFLALSASAVEPSVIALESLHWTVHRNCTGDWQKRSNLGGNQISFEHFKNSLAFHIARIHKATNENNRYCNHEFHMIERLHFASEQQLEICRQGPNEDDRSAYLEAANEYIKEQSDMEGSTWKNEVALSGHDPFELRISNLFIPIGMHDNVMTSVQAHCKNRQGQFDGRIFQLSMRQANTAERRTLPLPPRDYQCKYDTRFCKFESASVNVGTRMLTMNVLIAAGDGQAPYCRIPLSLSLSLDGVCIGTQQELIQQPRAIRRSTQPSTAPPAPVRIKN